MLSCVFCAHAADTSEFSNKLPQENSFKQYTLSLIGNSDNEQYNETVKKYISDFHSRFVIPISTFSKDYLNIFNDSLFYPFAGADISYPLLFFPHVNKFVLIGLEFPGQIDIVKEKYNLDNFKPQIEGFLKSGFFKTMKMSEQMHYKHGVIPMLVAQIGLLGGMVENITSISEPYKGILVDFSYNNLNKKLYYFRANLDDHSIKNSFFNFLKENKLIENCMLKASSYKLHQVEFKYLRQYMLDNCKVILQDDTGMPVKYLLNQNRKINLFGNYIQPYGEEFKPYYQKELANLYTEQADKTHLEFCFGYGCSKVEANILTAIMNEYLEPAVKPEIESN